MPKGRGKGAHSRVRKKRARKKKGFFKDCFGRWMAGLKIIFRF